MDLAFYMERLGADGLQGDLRTLYQLGRRDSAHRIFASFSIILLALAVAVQSAVSLAAPSPDDIVAKASQKLREVQALQADVAAEYSDSSGKAPVNMVVHVALDKASQVTRVEVTQHAVLEGQIVILDLKKDLATVYMPVTGQAFRGKTALIAAQLGGIDTSTFDIERLLSIDPAGVLSFKYIRQDKIDRLPYHVLESRSKDNPQEYQVVWVDCETYMVRRIDAYDNQGRKTASIMINNLKTNVKLDPNKLKQLPKGTKISDLK